MFKKSVIFLAVMLFGLYCTVYAATNAGDESWENAKVIKIGVATALTGPNAQYGVDAGRGAELAAKEINAKGGIYGKKIELVVYDEKGTPEQSIKAVTRLINQDKVVAIYGPLLSNSSMAIGEMLEKAKMPAFGAGVSATWTRQGWTYYFRPVCNTTYQMAQVPRIYKKLHAKKIAIFYVNDAYGNGSKDDMTKMLKEDGYELVGTETYKTGDQDFTGQCSKLIQSGADTIYMAMLSNDAGLFVKQLRQAGYKKPLVGDNTFSSKTIREVAKEAANNIYFTAPYVLPNSYDDIKNFNAIMRKFLYMYYKEYKETPTSDNVYRSYDGISLIAEALKNAKSLDGTKLRYAIENIADYHGLGGTFNFKGKHGDGIQTCRIYLIKEGNVVEVKGM